MKRKSILFLMLVFCMTFLAATLLTALAAYEDGYNCPSCGHYHWDNYTCGMCNRCSAECTNSDCYANNHCSSCGECFDGLSELQYCVECGECRDCYDTSTHCRYCGECGSDVCDCSVCEECLTFNNAACTECGKCLKCEDLNWQSVCQSCGTGACCAVICPFCGEACNYCEDELQCQNCGVCGDCAVDTALCDDCGLCIKCWDTVHCRACRSCIDEIDDCGFCMDCLSFNGQICSSCESCTQCDKWKSDDICPFCDACPMEYASLCKAEEHCSLDYEWECKNCEACNLCCDEVICEFCESVCGLCAEFCPDCGLCLDCCMVISADEGCFHYICTQSSEWDAVGHRCSQCLDCFDESEICDDCSLCSICCMENSYDEGCVHGYCVASAEWDAPDHRCQNCGDCFDEDYFCADCEHCIDCCVASSESEGCSHEVCVQSDEWDEHFCSECQSCIEDVCETCGGCFTCCMNERDSYGCVHDWLCPNDSAWDEHFCSSCNNCFDDSELCPTCDKCLECCLKETPCACGEGLCPESSEWSDHFCQAHKTCFSLCAHGSHTHEPSGSWVSEDANVHYQLCTICGNRVLVAKHALGEWCITKHPTTIETGLRQKACTTCGRVVQSETIPYLRLCAGGLHLPGEYEYNGEYHWTSCLRCNDLITDSFERHAFRIDNPKVCDKCGYTKIAKAHFATVGGLPLTADGKAQTAFVAKAGQNLVIPFELSQGDNVTILLLNPATGRRINYVAGTRVPAHIKKLVLYTENAVILNFSNLRSLEYYKSLFGNCGSTELILNAANDLGEEYDAQAKVTVTLPHETDAWQTNATHHWKVCTAEGCREPICEKGVHNWRSGDKCTVCGIGRPTRVTLQPEIVYTTYHKGRTSNVATLSVTARGENLKYAWYGESAFDENGELRPGRKPLANKNENPDSRYDGANTPTLTMDIDDYMCEECLYDIESYTFRCVVTGDNGTVTSAPIRVIVNHDTSSYRYTPLRDDVTKHSVGCINNCTEIFSIEAHTPGFWKTTTEPTVDQEGLKTYYCRDCGLTYQTEVIPKLAAPHTHDFSATGFDAAAHWKVCSDASCGHTDGTYTPHTYGEWETVTPATATTKGVKKRVCAEPGCQHEQTAPIALLSHICSFENSSYSFDAEGHWLKCENPDCSKTLKTAVHRYGEISFRKKPTKTETGEGVHTCTVCHYSKTVTLAALDEEPRLTLGQENGLYRIYASNAGIQSVKVYVASYAGGRLLDVKVLTLYHSAPVIDTSAQALGLDLQGADEIRAMMWDYTNIIPLMSQARFTISAQETPAAS